MENARQEQGQGYRHIHGGAAPQGPVELANQALQRGDLDAVLAAASRTPPSDKDYIHALILRAHAPVQPPGAHPGAGR